MARQATRTSTIDQAHRQNGEASAEATALKILLDELKMIDGPAANRRAYDKLRHYLRVLEECREERGS